MKLSTPLTTLPTLVSIQTALKTIDPVLHPNHHQLMKDLQVTPLTALWGDHTELPPATKEGLLWSATNAIKPKDNVTVKRHIKKSVAKGGRKKGSKGWSEVEVESLLLVIKDILPSGSKRWEKVALEHSYQFEDNNRDAKSCKRKFERLAFQTKPTGTTEIPRLVKMAKDIKEKISANEVMGLSAHNESSSDDETPDALAAANLRREDGEFCRPLTQRKRTN